MRYHVWNENRKRQKRLTRRNAVHVCKCVRCDTQIERRSNIDGETKRESVLKNTEKKLITCGGMNERKCEREGVYVCETTMISKTVWLIDWLTE